MKSHTTSLKKAKKAQVQSPRSDNSGGKGEGGRPDWKQLKSRVNSGAGAGATPGALQAPVGQISHEKKDTTAKLNIRFEFDKEEVAGKPKSDVHQSFVINPLLSRPGQEEINYADPQVQGMLKVLSAVSQKDKNEADDFVEHFQ